MKTTIIGGKDRSYYRAEPTANLIDEAKYHPNVELCIALGERLEKLQWKLDNYRLEADAERYDYDSQF